MDKTATYTPGPLAVSAAEAAWSAVYIHKEQELLYRHYEDGEVEGQANAVLDVMAREIEARCPLIASAPDLAEALRFCMRENKAREGVPTQLQVAALHRARAALKRAGLEV